MPIGSGRIARAVSCHAWSPDKRHIALSPNSSDVLIYEVGAGDAAAWKLVHTLSEHDSFVSGIDWSSDNKIVTCGHDRNAYVWSFDKGQWTPSLVILRISRAATQVKWSPSGKKFAVASGAKLVPVCHYEPDNNWWVSQLIKKHKSTVLSLAWHPNSKFLVTGSCDFKTRVFSAFMQEVEEDVEAAKWGAIFPAHNQFGECLIEFDQSSGWVESVSFSPSGNLVAWTSHDSSLFVASFTSPPQVSTVNHPFLPFVDIAFLGNNTIIAAGYNNNAFVFVNNGDAWEYADKVDKEGGAVKSEEKKTGFNKNISKFQDATSKGIGIGKESLNTQLKTLHQNAIMQITPFFNGAVATELATTGIDGRLQIWDLAGDAAALKLR